MEVKKYNSLFRVFAHESHPPAERIIKVFFWERSKNLQDFTVS
jgi:hypothetical protein